MDDRIQIVMSRAEALQHGLAIFAWLAVQFHPACRELKHRIVFVARPYLQVVVVHAFD